MRTWMIAICLSLLSAVAEATPKIQHWQTSQGATVLFLPTNAIPMVDVQLTFNAGSARDGETPGLARLTNSLLDMGAGGLSTQAIAEGFANVGAQISGDSRRDMAYIGVRSLSQPDYLQPAMQLLATLVQQPDFPEEEIERSKRQLLVLLQSEQQSPSEQLEKALFAHLYAGHPYATPVNGTAESVQRLTRQQVQTFHQRYYVAKNLTIAIVGDLTSKAARELANQLVAKLPAGEAAPALPALPTWPAGQTIKIDFPSSQTHVFLAAPGIGRDAADYLDLYVGNHILGGGGFSSRLMSEVREQRGLVYGISSSFSPMQQSGPFTINFQARSNQADTALTVGRETLQTFVEQGPSAAELQDALDNLRGGFALRIDSNRELLSYLTLIGFYHLPWDYLDHFQQGLDGVTQASIKAAFAARIQPQQLLTIILGGQGQP